MDGLSTDTIQDEKSFPRAKLDKNFELRETGYV